MDQQHYQLLSEQQASIDHMNGFIQLDQSPSILAFQVPGSCVPLANSQAGPGVTGKYAHLLNVIEELGKDIRPTYAGSKISIERLKRNIIQARFEIRQCLMELERNN